VWKTTLYTCTYVNVIVIMDLVLKELVCQKFVYAELIWCRLFAVVSFCKQVLRFGGTKIVIKSFRTLYALHNFFKISFKLLNFCIRRWCVINSYIIIV